MHPITKRKFYCSNESPIVKTEAEQSFCYAPKEESGCILSKRFSGRLLLRQWRRRKKERNIHNSGCICRFALEFCNYKKERTETLYQSFSPFMVEVWGVEPQSENRTTGLSPCAFYVLTFPLPRRCRRRCGFSSFIKSRPPQSLSGLVPCFYDADGLRRRRLRVDDRGLSRESYVFVVVSSF